VRLVNSYRKRVAQISLCRLLEEGVFPGEVSDLEVQALYGCCHQAERVQAVDVVFKVSGLGQCSEAAEQVIGSEH